LLDRRLTDCLTGPNCSFRAHDSFVVGCPDPRDARRSIGAARLTKIAESDATKAIVVRLGIGAKTVESHHSKLNRELGNRDNESGRSAASGNS
jgi:hypothetical protein